jgi:hypothetical protein
MTSSLPDITADIAQRAKVKQARAQAQYPPNAGDGYPPGFLPLRPLPVHTLDPVLHYVPEMLPENLRPWLLDVAERGQFPFDFLAVAAMSALGSIIGRRCAVYPKQQDDWHEYPNLWAAIIGRPGAMKSPALNAVLAPLRAIESQWAAQYSAALSQHEAELLRAGIEYKAAVSNAQKAAKEGNDFDTPERTNIEPPVCRRLLTSDPTEAKLGELLSQNPHGITLELDELAALNAMFEREPSLREFCLKGWSGKDSHTIDRIGRGTVRVEAVCLSVIGGIQPGRIAPAVSAAMQGAGGDGLLQRFQLIAWPDGWNEPWQNIDRWPDNQAKQNAKNLFERLMNMRPSDFPYTSEYSPHGLRFTREAQEIFNDWHTRLHQTLRGGGMTEALEASLAKGAKAVAGIALLRELAGNPNAKAIGTAALTCALEWGRVTESHTRRLFNIAQHTEASAALLIWKRIETGDFSDGFTAREIKQRHWSGLSDSAAVDAGLSILVECGWLRADRIENGGRPSYCYAINPAA